MNVYDKKDTLKYILLAVAVIIVMAFYYFAQKLSSHIDAEERSKVELWAGALREISTVEEDCNIAFLQKVIGENTTIPVILADSAFNVISHRNLPEKDYTPAQLSEIAEKYSNRNESIVINMPGNAKQYIYYDDSFLLKALTYVPFVIMFVVIVFLLCVVALILTIKQSEQNKLWIGLFKETAHQLGTPTSSLMAWTEVLKSKYPEDKLIPEMDKDTLRLKTIVERFSQVGSKGELELANLSEVITEVINYMRNRISRQVDIKVEQPNEVFVMLNIPLFEWVIENLCKNAVDAMEGRGDISIVVKESDRMVYIDVTDTGKGISKSKISKIFSPGFTTKKRGWGLGLSLSRRIIYEYHRGKIYVKYSQVDKGTTFTIELKKI